MERVKELEAKILDFRNHLRRVDISLGCTVVINEEDGKFYSTEILEYYDKYFEVKNILKNEI